MKIPGLVLTLAASVMASSAEAQPPAHATQTWRGCCGVTPWSQGGGMMDGHGMMGGGGGAGGQGMMGGSRARHHVTMMSGVPEPYTNARNPLAISTATIKRGATVYSANCASCHGATGLGDGEAARNLSPRPANLARLSDMPMSHWDPYMYWTIAEGGKAFGTAMPAFKDTLPKEDIWAVTAYIQAHLPESRASR